MGTVATARFLIIGNSAAGVKAAEAIRRRCLRGLITVVTEERCPSYARPRLADYVAERLPERALWGVSRNFYTRNNIGLILDKKAVKVDVKASKVLCADGEEIAYDVLLIATGATPNRLSCPGADLNGVATLRTLADAVRIRDRARTAKEVVVVGGGLLGMDLAQAFLERKLKVHHLVREKGLGSPALDPEAARIVEARFREHGATISFEEEVAEFTGAGWELSGVVTTKGRRLSCQLATVSIGVRPNTDFLRGSGLEMDRGILVDGAMRTNIENIYAAGDVAQLRGGAGRPAGIQTSWFNAGAQGQLAGYNMATGEGKDYLDPAFNFIDVFESGLTTFGETRVQDSHEVLKGLDEPNRKYRRLSFKENRLVGGLVVDGVAQVQEFTLLAKYRFDVSEFKDKLLDPAFSPVEAIRQKQKDAAALGLPVGGQVIHKMRCTRCGYIMIGEIPDNCPLCGAPKEEFEPMD